VEVKRPYASSSCWIACALCALIGCDENVTPSRPQGPEASAAKNTAVEAAKVDTANAIIFRMGDRQLSVDAFAKLLGPAPQRRTRQPEHERRRAFLDEVVRVEVLAERARSQGAFDGPAFERAARELQVDTMMQSLFGENGSLVAKVTDDDIRKFYDENPEEFAIPAQVRVSHVLLKTAQEAHAVLQQARGLGGDMTRFAALAREQSQDEYTRLKGGDLGYFGQAPSPTSPADVNTSASMRKKVVPIPVREAAFSLRESGEVYDRVVKSDLGFHVIALVHRREGSRYELAQVTRAIRERLEVERRTAAVDAFVGEIEKRAHIEINESALARVRVPKP
jgi:peptidyl-prolyl cis-trans isomerase C